MSDFNWQPGPLTDLYLRFATAILVGALIGIQREFAHSQQAEDQDEELFAGTRTFALVALLGCTSSYLSEHTGFDYAPLVFLAISALTLVAYLGGTRRGLTGMTTEVAALATFVFGVIAHAVNPSTAAALGVCTAVILALKFKTVELTHQLTREDMYAFLTFAVISIVILPVLPREPIGPSPFDVIIPFKVWLMVVFITGLSFAGYALLKTVGPGKGIGVLGILGGLVSSTAATMSFSQNSRVVPGLTRAFGMAILLSWSMMFARVLVEVAVVYPPLLAKLSIPMAVAFLVSIVLCIWIYTRSRGEIGDHDTEFKNPFELGPAFFFGLMYAVILLIANAARIGFGDTGLYASSIVSGLVDVDAITLSMAEIAKSSDTVELTTASRAIVLAVVSNTAVKGGIVLLTGSPSLRRQMWPMILGVTAVTLVAAFTIV